VLLMLLLSSQAAGTTRALAEPSCTAHVENPVEHGIAAVISAVADVIEVAVVEASADEAVDVPENADVGAVAAVEHKQLTGSLYCQSASCLPLAVAVAVEN
jgi:hypothetical protein